MTKKTPLETLGVTSPVTDNLLDEAMAGTLGMPGHSSGLSGKRSPKGFEDAITGARRDLKANFLGQPLSPEEDNEPEVKDEIVEETDPEEESDVTEPIAAKTSEVAEEKELPDYYHTLNHQSEAARQQAEEANNRANANEARLQELMQRLAPQEKPVDYAQYGLEPEQYNFIEQSIMQKVSKANLPILHQLVQDRFKSAISRMEADNPHWKEYFPTQYIQNFYQQVASRYPVDYLATVNWESELSNAYTVKDYPRLRKELESLREKQDMTTKVKEDKKKESKEQQKADLKLVPKASQKGVAAAKDSDEKEDIFYRKSSSKGFDGVANRLKDQFRQAR